MRRLGVVALVFGVLAVTAGAAPQIGGGGRIVFVSNRAPDLAHTRFAAVTPTGSRTLEVGIAPYGAALAPDRARYAYVEYEAPSTWRLRVGDFGGAPSVTVATHAYGIENPVWSPRGDWIAYTATNPASCGPGDHLCVTHELWVVRRYGGDRHKIADRAADPVWAPNGKLLAFAGEYETYAANDGLKGKPWVANVSGEGLHRLVDVYGVDRISWSPGSDRVVVSGHRGFAVVVPVRSGKVRKVSAARAAVWSPRGDAIAFARGKSILLVRPTGRVIRVIRVASAVEAITWSPNASQLAYVAGLPVGGPVPRTVARRVLVTVSSTGRNARIVARFDRFQLAKLLGWLREGYVLYETWREVNDFDVLTMSSDGTDVRRVTDDDLQQFDPAWSPDGRRVVFAQSDEASQRTELRLLTVGGVNTRVTDPPAGANDLEPAWSSDGTLIAFTRYTDPNGGASNIFVIRPDGTGSVQVTEGLGYAPAWWPDSRHLVFTRNEGSRRFLYTIAIDGSDERRLFEGLWGVPSADGARIAYTAERARNAVGLWVADADGANARLLAADPWGSPSWSPDGTLLVFQRFFPGVRGRLLEVPVAGGAESVVGDVGADDRSPTWSRVP